MFKIVRIGVLLLILAAVAQGAWLARARAAEWRYPLKAVVYPINGDATEASAAYIAGLTKKDFVAIEEFIVEEAGRYGVKVEYGSPMEIDLAPEVPANPPMTPQAGNALQIVSWSLRLRYWAWRHDAYNGPAPHIRMFVRYFDPTTTQRLGHSLGLRKGMLGVVNAFSVKRMTATNNVVIAHEMLHTLGATDKYDALTNLPVFPDGYADPGASPRFPQQYAELMGGRLPVSEAKAEIPQDLSHVLIGERTAIEINWVKQPD
jgi:hypothetical protein